MRRSALLLCPLVLAASAGAADPSPEPEDDAKTILGTWQSIAISTPGPRETPFETDKFELEVAKDKLRIIDKRGKKPRDEIFAYKLDPRAKPCAIGLTRDGPKGIVIRGIYKIEKGELTIAIDEQDGVRPKAFDEKGRTVLVFHKAKAKK